MARYIHVIFTSHSIIRWLVLGVAVISFLKLAWSWLRGGEFKRADRVLNIALAASIDLQALLGQIYFLWTGFNRDSFPRFRFEHGGAMFLALLCIHLPLFWTNMPGQTRLRNNLIAVLASILFILLGISRLPGGLTR